MIGLFIPFCEIYSQDHTDSNKSENQTKKEIFLVDVNNIPNHTLMVGEKLTYKVKIGWVSVGQRVDYIVQKTSTKGQDVYHISSTAKTGAFGRVYRFQSLQNTYLNSDQLQPVRFRNQLLDRKYSALVDIRFGEGQAEYVKKSQANPKAPEKLDKKVITTPFGTQDELSMVYFLRCKQLAPGNIYFFPLISKGKVVKVQLRVENGEKLKVKGLGEVKTLVVHTSEGSRLWLTDDRHHLPVRIEADTKIGKTTAVLAKREIIR